ncbi:hypothetical protein FO519_005258 [Halicephalobus sp. NKZ332]|nr:hypothetical protein FO519_005258 [Halicephalobus sp. NKZ332]
MTDVKTMVEIKKEPGIQEKPKENEKDNEEKISSWTSFHYNQFAHAPTLELNDRALLYKARKNYEVKLEGICRSKVQDATKAKTGIPKDEESENDRKAEMFEIYVKLGHINLLAMDHAKAMFAYQRAIKLDNDKFRAHKAGLYGVGLVYFHFKAYPACIEAFNHLLYLDSDLEVSQEIQVRLGIAQKNIGNFEKAAKHLTSAFDDLRNTPLFSKPEIKFHIAHCFDAAGDLKTAFEEYRSLKEDPAVQKDPKLLANVCRALEGQNPHDAFVNYRHAIDKNEHDADTWCSIGVLYQLQNQDTDALQAFICAIQLSQTHNQAWACLGKLYENHFQYKEALYCYKKAVHHKSSHPEPLKRRIQLIQKTLLDNATAFLRAKQTTFKNVEPLPLLEKAWHLGIPAELRPHQREFIKDNNAIDNFLAQALEEPSTSCFNEGEHEEGISQLQGGELPPNFSLLAPIYVPITITAKNYNPIFEENCSPPKPEVVPLKQRPGVEKLALKTPLIKVEKPSEANSVELQNFCYQSPIALIRGLTSALKMDLSLFSTKSLIETQPDYPVEVRTQYRMPGDINVDQLGQASWNCYSAKSHTTVSRYGSYQAESFRHSLKEETERLKAAGTGSKYAIAAAQAAAAGMPLGTIATTAPAASLLSISNSGKSEPNGPPTKRRRTGQAAVNASGDKLAAAAVLAGGPDDLPVGQMPMRIVKFGTNVDLSDENKFPLQLRELNKMPAFCRNSATCNFLSHLGHTVLGMNTVQLYMKVPGCRTPGHLENNCFASVNINIGPGECEWFGVDYEYWPVIDKMCKDRGLDLMKGSWWPNFEDLVRARVPVYRFTQKAGDLVWVGGGCVHWVQSIGWCNNVAWNVGPMTAEQLKMSLYSHEWNKLTNYRSLVPMQHLCWQLAQNVRFSDQKIFNVVKSVMIRSLAYCKMVHDYVLTKTKSQIKFQPRIKGEAAHYCHTCDIEVFNLLFVKEFHNKFKVFCVQCAKKANFEEYVVLQQITFEDLSDIFDRFQLHPAKTPLLC